MASEARIAEFELAGNGTLAAAGEELLYGPLDIQAAVIRGIGTPVICALGDQTKPEIAEQAIHHELPGLNQLHASIREWLAQRRLPDYCSLGSFVVVQAGGSIAVHTDRTLAEDLLYLSPGSFEGPLTFSLRVNDPDMADGSPSDIRRLFFVRATTASHFLMEGIDWHDADAAIGQLLEGQGEAADPHQGMYGIEQKIGDLVLWRNYPYPTLHSVEERYISTNNVIEPSYTNPRTCSLIGQWSIAVDV